MEVPKKNLKLMMVKKRKKNPRKKMTMKLLKMMTKEEPIFQNLRKI